MELLKLLSASEITAQIVNFLLLLVFLRVFFWRRILGALDKRRERIAAEFKQIEDARQSVEDLKSDYAEKIGLIGEFAKERIQEAQDDAQKAAEAIKKEANLVAQRAIDSAKLEMRYEIAKAKEELKGQIVDLTIKAAENLVTERLTAQDDKKLVEEFINEIGKKI
jgi:F-type H+-transporting ATPase subunit b